MTKLDIKNSALTPRAHIMHVGVGGAAVTGHCMMFDWSQVEDDGFDFIVTVYEPPGSCRNSKLSNDMPNSPRKLFPSSFSFASRCQFSPLHNACRYGACVEAIKSRKIKKKKRKRTQRLCLLLLFLLFDLVRQSSNCRLRIRIARFQRQHFVPVCRLLSNPVIIMCLFQLRSSDSAPSRASLSFFWAS